MMKRYLLTLVITLMTAAAAPAAAQMGPNDPYVNVNGTICNPISVRAKARDASIGPNFSGLWMSHWCRDADGKYWLQIGVVSVADVSSFTSMAHDWMLAVNGSDYDADMAAYRKKFATQTGSPYDPKYKPIWYPSLAVIMAAKPADEVVAPPSPPPKVCSVAANGIAKTRQWYPFSAGARTSTSGGGSVTIAGAACKLDVATVTEGSTIYGAFGPAFRADRVTVCTCQ